MSFTPESLKALYRQAIAQATRTQYGDHDRLSYAVKPDYVWIAFAQLVNDHTATEQAQRQEATAPIRQQLAELLHRTRGLL